MSALFFDSGGGDRSATSIYTSNALISSLVTVMDYQMLDRDDTLSNNSSIFQVACLEHIRSAVGCQRDSQISGEVITVSF